MKRFSSLGGWSQMLRSLAPTAVFAAAVGGLAFGSGLVFVRLIPVLPPAVAGSATSSPPSNLELAQGFTATLNAHDVDALAELFTDDEDSGGTVHADRYAWNKFEIRAWAQRQVRANTHTDARDYRVTEHGAVWNAEVYREDWRQLGVDSLRVRNSIWVHDGKLVDFTSKPLDPHDAERLGHLWQPGASP
jgi:hypothetical protein